MAKIQYWMPTLAPAVFTKPPRRPLELGIQQHVKISSDFNQILLIGHIKGFYTLNEGMLKSCRLNPKRLDRWMGLEHAAKGIHEHWSPVRGSDSVIAHETQYRVGSMQG
ncbi:hypothetical protein D3C78_1225930 [compost metagenome]